MAVVSGVGEVRHPLAFRLPKQVQTEYRQTEVGLMHELRALPQQMSALQGPLRSLQLDPSDQ